MATQIEATQNLSPPTWRPGPITTGRLRRTQLLYLAALVCGCVPYLIDASPAWKALGLGAWLPGAGFLALGPWGIVPLVLTFSLFATAVFAWFAAGAIIFPLLVWAGSAVLAAWFAPETPWPAAPYLAGGVCMALGLTLYRRTHGRRVRDAASAVQRKTLLPGALQDARARAAARTPSDARELSDEELANARYLLDRVLQPLDCFDGFDCIDKFQTAAIRYQINFIGYGLSQLQQLYAPNFHGYLSLAQRNGIEKYLQRRVWDYWVYESCWGHLNLTNWDPARDDNIMLTGYYGAQVALYCGNTGDSRYEVPGSLTFRLNDKKAWPHDVHSITRSVVDNYRRSAYCLYPCEPNWIYAGCNFRGMTTLAAYDRAFRTEYVASVRDSFLEQLDREFTNGAGGIVGLRSSLTGIEFPFPSSDLGYCLTTSTFCPERAERMWALVQFGMRRLLGREGNKPVLLLPDKGIDFGNYRRGALCFAMGALLAAAREFGDAELAEAAINTLDLRCGRTERDGVIHYSGGSNLANSYIAAARFMRREDYREVFSRPPSRANLSGPLLSEAKYPDVLVARAMSNGEDLDLVLVPGAGGGRQSIGLSRLVPGRAYAVAGRPDLSFTADPQGAAQMLLELTGRTRIHLSPRAS
jgi:hypothetical protein